MKDSIITMRGADFKLDAARRSKLGGASCVAVIMKEDPSTNGVVTAIWREHTIREFSITRAVTESAAIRAATEYMIGVYVAREY